jgi:hypothetical protein
VYLDGELLYRFGKVSSDPDSEQVYLEGNPRSVIFKDQTNHLLSVRYSNLAADKSDSNAGFTCSIIPDFFFLSADRLQDNISLSGWWKYHRGDNKEWANPEFNDSEWETTNTWFNSNKLPKSGWNGIGWFRLHVAVDSTLWNRPLALNVLQWGASEIYLDGRLLAQFGKVGSTKHDEEGYFAKDPDLLPPPKSILFNKANHVIAVRFSDFYLTEKYPRLRQGLQIILSDLNSTIASSASQSMANANIQMVVTIVPVVFAILHLLLFLFYQRAKENLYFALFTFMLGAWLFAAWQTIFSPVTDLRQALLFQKLIPGIGTFAFISGLRFLYALFYPRLPKQFWIFLLIVACYATLEWGSPFREPKFYIGIIAGTIPLEILRVSVVAIWRKKDGSWIIGTGFIFFVVASMSGVLYVNSELANKAIAPLLLLSGLFGLLLSMSVFLARNISRTEVDNARKTHELEEARKLQLSMLPKTIPTHPNLEIAVFMQTATEVGGDYYDFHLAENGTLTIAVGDATGHGMQAGTMVAATKSLFNSLADEPEPVQILKKGTKAIKAMGLRKMFMALTIAKFKDHQMHVSAAGMPFTLVYRASTGQVEELELKGLPLGVLLDFNFQEKKLQLNDGDTVLFLSDGFEEMFNQQNEILGDDKAKEHFQEVATSSPEDIIEHLKKAAKAWAGGCAQRDDVTFVVVKIKQ